MNHPPPIPVTLELFARKRERQSTPQSSRALQQGKLLRGGAALAAGG
jgi:hypothetical protein